MNEFHGQSQPETSASFSQTCSADAAAHDSEQVGGLLPREIDRIEGGPSGSGKSPLLICVGGIHGNEPGGVHALKRVTQKIREQEELYPLSGTLLALRGNRAALANKKRYIDMDLNRAWAVEDLQRVRTQDPSFDGATDREVRELLSLIDKARLEDRPIGLLDLHSTSGGGPPFSVVLGGKPSEKLAARIGVPCVHGLNEAIQGTLTSWFANVVGPSIVVEGGESRTEETVRHLEAAVWSSLAVAGLLPDDHPSVKLARQVLSQATEEIPHHVNVYHREQIKAMHFHMASPGNRRFKSFDFVHKGDHLADNKKGPVVAQKDGFLIMPLYQNKGSDGFFLAEPCEDPSL